MKVYKKIMDVLAGVEKFGLIATGAGCTLLTFIAVCVRKLNSMLSGMGASFKFPQFTWSEELVINFFVLMIMCGCALAAREGGLISLSLIYDAVSLKAKKVLAAIVGVVNSAFYILVIKTGFDKVAQQIANNKRTSILMWPEWIFTIVLPIGCILMVLHTIEYCMEIFAMKEDPAELEKGEEA